MTTGNAAHRKSLSTPGEWSLTGYSETPSRNGVAWSGVIRRNGVAVGQASDEGVGGMTEFEWTSARHESDFLAEETARYGEPTSYPGDVFVNDLATLAQYSRLRRIVFFTDDTDLKWGDILAFRSGVTLAQAKASLTFPAGHHADKNPMIFDKRAKIFVAAADIEP
jgi:hypothetical protein